MECLIFIMSMVKLNPSIVQLLIFLIVYIGHLT
jgi:hypothetical protein